jgi:pSer/pThr/pTyr-binding forkhead associated (FHA) protein
MGGKPVLVCTAGAIAGQTIEVPEGGLDLGRAEENHVVIRDEGVSRFHARLLFENGSLWLQDAGSRNGVFVNGMRVSGHQAIKVGDTIAIAEHRFEIRWAEDTGEPKTPKPDEGTETTEPDGTPRRRWFWPFS